MNRVVTESMTQELDMLEIRNFEMLRSQLNKLQKSFEIAFVVQKFWLCKEGMSKGWNYQVLHVSRLEHT